MRAMAIIVADPARDPGAQFSAGFESMQIYAFIFQRTPQPLNENVVHPAAAPIHADPDALGLQNPAKAGAGELTVLIGIHNSGILPNTRAPKSPFTTHITHAQANAQR